MSEQTSPRIWRTTPFWAMLTFFAFGAVAALASSGAINTATTLILMIVPAGLFFQMIRTANRPPICGAKGEARRRYVKRVAIFSSAYLLAFGIQIALLKDANPPIALRAALAALPGFAILGIFWAIGRLIVEERDEFMRMLIVRQSLVATALALSFATLWGFLEGADVVPHIEGYWFAVAWFFGQFVGALANRIQYGTWGAL